MTSSNATTSAFRIDGKTALLTGGASGLGLAGAKALLDAGAAGITLVDLNPSALTAATSDSGPLGAYKDKVHVFSGVSVPSPRYARTLGIPIHRRVCRM